MIGKRIKWTHFRSKRPMTGTVMDCSWSPHPDGGGDWELLVALNSGKLALVSAIGESAKIIEDAPQKSGSLRDELMCIVNLPGVASVNIKRLTVPNPLPARVAITIHGQWLACDPGQRKSSMIHVDCNASESEISSSLRELSEPQWTREPG